MPGAPHDSRPPSTAHVSSRSQVLAIARPVLRVGSVPRSLDPGVRRRRCGKQRPTAREPGLLAGATPQRNLGE